MPSVMNNLNTTILTINLMKPKKHRKRNLVILILVLILVVATIIVAVVKGRKPSTQYEEVAVSVNDTITKTSILTGSIEPRDLVQLKPQISGIVSELYKLPGDTVLAGDIVAKLSVVPDVGQVQAAGARVESARLAEQQAKEIYEREKGFYQQKVSSKEQFEKVQNEYERAQVELKAAIDNLEIARTGSSASTRKSNSTQVRATVSGTILEQPVKVGQSVIQSNNFNDGTTIASVANLKDLLFVGKVNESDVSKIEKGMEVVIRAGALPDISYKGVIEYVSPKGTETNGAVMFEVKAAILPDPELDKVKAGFSSNAEVVLEKREGITTIPEKCIVYEGDKSYVYVKKGSEYKKQEVEPGISDGLKTEIISGLNPKDVVRGVVKD